MKNINKIIYSKCIEIMMVVLIAAISFPLWKKLENNEVLSIASSYADVQYSHLEVEYGQNSNLYPMSNENALKTVNPTILTIVNDSKTEEEYTLYLSITKTSSLDFHCLNISFNDIVKPLDELFVAEDEATYYFALISDKLNGETKNYPFKMWMDESTGNEMQGKTLNYNFELQKQFSI